VRKSLWGAALLVAATAFMAISGVFVFVAGGDTGTAFTYAYLVLPPLLIVLGARFLERS
jgi:hypothetical protein